MSWVYFIQARESGHFKIGYSSNHPVSRLLSFQTGNPDELVLRGWFKGSQRDERHLHELLRAYRVRGEWFRNTDRVEGMAALCSENHDLRLPQVIGPPAPEMPSDEVIALFEELKASLSSAVAANDQEAA